MILELCLLIVASFGSFFQLQVGRTGTIAVMNRFEKSWYDGTSLEPKGPEFNQCDPKYEWNNFLISNS